MHHRRRRSAVGLILIGIVAGAGWLVVTGASAASPTTTATAAPVPLLAAAVSADGVPAGPTVAWQAVRVDQGTYRLTFAEPTRVSVQTWEAAASVVVRPVTDQLWSVTFADADGLVDSGFSFLAAPIR